MNKKKKVTAADVKALTEVVRNAYAAHDDHELTYDLRWDWPTIIWEGGPFD